MLLQNLKKKNDNVPTLQIDDEIAVLLSDDDHDNVETDPVVIVNLSETGETGQTSSQGADNQSTITLSNPSQNLPDDFEQFDNTASHKNEEKKVQTDDCVIVMSKEEYENLFEKASSYVDYKAALEKLSNYFSSVLNQAPEMDATIFEKVCKQVGAETYSKFWLMQ